jgi:hypothetical protein
MANTAAQLHANRFLQLNIAVTRFIETFNRQEDARVEAAIQAGKTPAEAEVERNEAVNRRLSDEYWIAESYEGRSGAPFVRFSQIRQLVEELHPVMESGTPLTAAQELALEYACMAADIA